jgi:O-antigen ligase
MLSTQKEKYLNILISLGCIAVGLFITPDSSLDPINVPKLFLLIIFAFTAVSFVFIKPRNLIQTNKLFLILIFIFVLDLALVLFFSGAPFLQQLNGTYGRNTGFLAYLSLAIIGLVSSLTGSIDSLRRISYSLLGVGLISLVYSTMQTTGNDPVKWTNPYNSILGFLGNPDFESSFLGFCAIVSVSFALKKSLNVYLRIAAFVYVLWSLFLMIRSHAQQGVLVFGIGVAVVLLLWMRGNSRFSGKKWISGYISFGAIVSTVVILGTLKMGPLGETLYKISVRQRGYYWRAAIEMMKNHPTLGVGLDSYGDWYFRSRSADAALKSAAVQSNAAHNVFLDLGATGGFPLFVIHIAITLLSGYCLVKVARRIKTYTWEFAAITGAWLAYEAQAFVSINQLGLAIWGWTFTGLLVGYEIRTRQIAGEIPEVKQENKTNIKIKRKVNESMTPALLASCVGFAISLAIALPGFIADANSRKASAAGNASALYDAVLKYPEDTQRTLLAAQLLANNNLKPQALELVNHVIKVNPNNYNFWQIKYELVDKKSAEGILVKNRINELNPRVPLK